MGIRATFWAINCPTAWASECLGKGLADCMVAGPTGVGVDAKLIGRRPPQVEQGEVAAGADGRQTYLLQMRPIEVAARFALEAVAHHRLGECGGEVVRRVEHAEGVGRTGVSAGA